MGSALTGRLQPPSAAATPVAAATPAAAAAAIPVAASPAVDLSFEEIILTPVILGGGFPCYSRTPHSRFDKDAREGERRRNFRSEDAPCLGLLHEVFTDGSVRAEPGH